MESIAFTYAVEGKALEVNALFLGEALEKNAPEPFFCLNAYTYGFNGQEKDDEIKGSGNSYDFGARSYDPRIGRFKSIDPYTVAFPAHSPYSYALNNPIYLVDADGMYPKPSEVLADFGFELPPLAAGILDGAADASPLGMAGFVYDLTTDGQFRADMVDAFSAIANDPVGAMQVLFEEYAGTMERVMAGEATDEDLYLIGEEIGAATAGLITGGAIAKYSKKLLKMGMPKGIKADDIFTNSLSSRVKAEDFALSSNKYKGFKNANKEIRANNPTFDLFDESGNVVDVTTTAAKSLNASSFHGKLKNLSNLSDDYGSRTLQIYTKKGQYSSEQLQDLQNKLNTYIKDNNLNVNVSIDQVE